MLKIISVIFGVGVFFLFLSAPSFAATISITSSPSSATLLQEFNISFSGSELDADSTYYAKVRIGQAGSDSNPYDQGETKSGDSWLRDSSGWGNFPVFITDSAGVVSGSLTARARSTTHLGENSIFVRIRKSGTTTNIDSAAATITLTEATPTPSPTPSPSPAPSPSTTPTPTASSTSPSPTATPKPTTTTTPSPSPSKSPSPSPNPAGASKITKTSTGTATPESLVLGITDAGSVSANTDESVIDERTTQGKPFLGLSSKQYLAGGLAVLGALFLGASVFLFFKEKTSGTIDRTDESN